MGTIVEAFPYRPDSAQLFASVASRPWAAFLDSCSPGCATGRFDVIAWEPRVTLQSRGEVTEIRCEGAARLSREDPFELLRRYLGPPVEAPGDLPFYGGAIGYFSYDLGRHIERLPATAADPLGLPEMAVGIYDWALVVDHAEGRSWLVGRADSPPGGRERLEAVARGGAGSPPPRFLVQGPLASNMDDAGYAERYQRVQRYIRDGDCYQINLARRFSLAANGDPWAAYCALRRLSPAPFAAYLNTPAVQVLSSSPERFLRVSGGAVETRPIKGTRRRGLSPEEDRRLREELAVSPKDRAENLMIVDLLRNDLGRTCALGSIRVPSLFEVESFANVHHLVSTVTGRLAPGEDALSLLRGCFPGGSITGAPKIRAMEIIEELEGERRSVYCGSIGYLGFDGRFDGNIAIRTMIHAGGELRFWAGGGIVSDSTCAEEAAEIAVKARAMREVAERFRTEKDGSALPKERQCQLWGVTGR
ncbi:MAG: aminodeoxychorismate synthase component I [Pseudomonadota bacterium]|nr:aminodeoxychorismate synthase component I [Pseudomonadota bacterium]